MFSTLFRLSHPGVLSLILLFSGLFCSHNAKSGSLPFPQNVNYAYGIKPSNADHSDALKAYEQWKYFYSEQVNDTLARLIFNANGETVSEGIAYGMLLSGYADDKKFFDDLWRYYKRYRNGRGLMHWRIGANGSVTGWNAATDAELDAAMALIVADKQWGSSGTINYMQDALILIDLIMEHEVEKPTFVLKPGDVWGGTDVTNPSYFAPAYYRIFHQLTGDERWQNVIDTTYAILKRNAHPQTGLVSDWCKADGTQSGNRGYDFFYDATRFPWRIAIDYLWFGVDEASEYCKKMSTFVRNTVGGSTKVVDGYTIDGTKIGTGHSNAFVGPFAVAAMGTNSSYQAHLNSSYTDLTSTASTGYFDMSLEVISLFVLTGNFYRVPDPAPCRKPDLGSDVSLCDSPFYTLQTGLNSKNVKFKWNTGESTPSINALKVGTYIVSTDSLGCLSGDTIIVSGLDIDLGPDRQMPLTGLNLDVTVPGSDVTYLWNTGEISSSINADSVGEYWVVVDSSGCVASDTVSLSFESSNEVLLYPNPAVNGRTNILIMDPGASEVTVYLYSEKGELIKTLYSGSVVLGQEKPIDTGFLSGGIYFLKVKWNGNEKVKKLLVP